MADLRTRYAALWAARSRARAAFRSGRSARLELARAFDGFEDFAGGEAIAALAREHESERFEAQRESARRLLRGAQARALEASTLALEVELRERERRETLRIGRQERALFDWLAQACTLDSDPRAELARGLERADASLAPLRAEFFARRSESLAKLGFARPRAWAEALRPGVALDAWADEARRVLRETESAWHDAKRAAGAASAGNALELGCALARPRDAASFAGRAWDALDSLTVSWRLALRELGGVALDAAARERAHPAAFLARPRVPGELLIRLEPRTPLVDLAQAFALGGRALALAFTSESLPVEQRLLGDRAPELAWGELFAQRLADPDWLATGPAAGRVEGFATAARALALARLRGSAARSLTELALAELAAGSDARALADAHAGRMREALGCDWSANALLRDCRSEPAALDELRAACLAAQLTEKLRERHGRDFWRARAAGELLKELWHTGATYSAEDLARQLELGPLSADLLVQA